MTREVCLFLDLKDDPELIAEYERRHVPGAVWPEILDHIRAQGFVRMRIWRAMDRLVMVAEVEDDWPRETGGPADDAIVLRWESEMDVYQRKLSTGRDTPKWTPAFCIFDLDQHEL